MKKYELTRKNRKDLKIIEAGAYAYSKAHELCNKISLDRDFVPDITPFFVDTFKHGVAWSENNPIGALDEEFAWSVYNFINDWKNGKYGEINLQDALRMYYKEE